jgi:hypothetical protein
MASVSDDRFEEWIREAASDYNRPPASEKIPRDAMWQIITTASRTAESKAPDAGGAAGIRAPGSTRPRLNVWRIAAVAAAAVVLLATGIGIGQWMQRDRSTQSVQRTPVTPQSSDSNAISTYDVAAAQFLTSAEALLTAYRGTPVGGVDAELQNWARELLADTRLLIDSPVADDATRKRLLQDLELVLVQIVQLQRGSEPITREGIERSLERENLLTRIRTTIPAGAASGL